MDRILGFDIQTLIQIGIMLFNILLTVYIIYRLLYKPVLKYLESRAEKIRKQIDETNTAKIGAESLKHEYEQSLINVENERNEILDIANKRAREKESQLIIEAKTEADIIRNRGILDVQREKDKLRDNIKNEIIEISNIMASKYISKTMDKESQNKLFDEVITDLGEMKWQN